MTTSNKDFYFGLLRVSMVQLLKSQGFDKAKPSTVDKVTDLYIRFLQLLVQEVMKLSEARMGEGDEVILQDISQAMQNLGVLKPMDILDVYDENPDLPSNEGMRRFKDWCIHSVAPKEALMVATPTPDLLRAKDKTSKPLSMIPEYINQLNTTAGQSKKNNEDQDSDLIEQMINNGDMDNWVRFITRKQQLAAARKLSNKEPKDLDTLPSVPGLKYSVISKRPMINNEYVPLSAEKDEEGTNYATERMLLSKLPISRKENRLESITLSFDEDFEEGSGKLAYDDSKNFTEETFASELQEPQQFQNDNTINNESSKENHLDLNPNSGPQFTELEDMNNTFQRRESFTGDYGTGPYHSHRFDFDSF